MRISKLIVVAPGQPNDHLKRARRIRGGADPQDAQAAAVMQALEMAKAAAVVQAGDTAVPNSLEEGMKSLNTLMTNTGISFK